MLKTSKKFMLTYLLIAANVIVYAYTSLVGGNFMETSEYVRQQYGQVNFLVLNGWYWQLFTAMFVHVSIVHLAGNMLFLLIFGLRAEDLFAVHEYFLIYFLSGLAGNLLTLLLGPNMVSAGASGAIFGLFGACMIYIRRTLGQSIIGALIFSFFLLLINSGAGVNNLAHLGGLVAGLVAGYALAVTRRPKPTHTYRYGYTHAP